MSANQLNRLGRALNSRKRLGWIGKHTPCDLIAARGFRYPNGSNLPRSFSGKLARPGLVVAGRTPVTDTDSQAPLHSNPPSGFLTTRWSVIARAGEVESEQSQIALGELCEIYWYPVYAFIRRRGQDADAALDLTQGFFARLLDRRDLFQADSERGRFRAYLLGAVKNFLSNQKARENSERRGGGRELLSLDFEQSEVRYQMEPEAGETAEQVFDRSWARTLLSSVMGRLRIEYEQAGKLTSFQDLRGCLMSDGSLAPYRAIAEQRGTSEGAIKVAAYRLRRRFGELLRTSIAETLRDPGEVEEELRGLFRALETH